MLSETVQAKGLKDCGFEWPIYFDLGVPYIGIIALLWGSQAFLRIESPARLGG
jgi:hypothetical protein